MQFSTKVLKRRPIFRNFLAASGISHLGNHIFDITMPLWIWDKTHSPLALSYVSIALTLPYFVMAPLIGYVVDSYDNRKLMLFSDLGQIGLLTALFLLDLGSLHSLAPILITVFACKTLSILFETVSTFHLVPNLVKAEELSEANTWFFSSYRLIEIVGPLIGGLLISAVGFRSSIIVNLLSFSATLFFVFRMKELSRLLKKESPDPGRRVSVQRVMAHFRSSLSYVWKSPVFRGLVSLMFFWNLSSLNPFSTTMTYYFSGLHHFNPTQYGAVMSTFGLLSILGFVISNRFYQKWSFGRALSASALWQTVFGTLAVIFSHQPLLFIGFFAISRVGTSVMAMGTFLVRQTGVPRHQTGSVNAALRMLFMSAGPVSGGLQGTLIQTFGVDSSFLFGTAALWVAAYFGRRTAAACSESPSTGKLAA